MGKSVQKLQWTQWIRTCFFTVSAFLFVSCSQKSDVSQAKDEVLVKIGVQNSANEYSLQVVQLKGIEKLQEVSGAFARFFYSPGSSGTHLTGTSPRAQFVRTKNFFVPSDVISMQMAAIYYHLQNLAALDVAIGADGVNRWPRSVGLETQIQDESEGLQKNNAFYNGQTDSMMFVPYTNSQLPIAVNAGIIAHEHFHSLFFKKVLRPAFAARKISISVASIHAEEKKRSETIRTGQPAALTEEEKAQLFNETFLRGANEGLADFWGWVYTDDPEFMRWSLPEFQAERTLNLDENRIGSYETKEKITRRIEEAVQFSENPQGQLVNYSYQIGTPFARFLKHLTALQAVAKNIELVDSKKLMAQVVFNYMKDLGEKAKALQAKETIDPLSLFQYVATLAQEKSLIQLDQASCGFLIKYFNLNQVEEDKLSQCKDKESDIEPDKKSDQAQNSKQKGQKDSSFVVVTP